MATNSSNDRRRGGGAQRANPALVPGLLAVVLIVVAVAVAVLTKPDKTDKAPPAGPTNPFADLPPEAAPPPREHRAGSDLPYAPDGISTEPLWVAAKATAAEARELYEAAATAKAKGDTAALNEKGRAARKKYNEAIEATAAWEEDILAKYNPYDSKIVAIKDARTDWFNKLRWLEKSVGH